MAILPWQPAPHACIAPIIAAIYRSIEHRRPQAPHSGLNGEPAVSKSVVPPTGDRGFESIPLQRGVKCEPDFLDQEAVSQRSFPRGGPRVRILLPPAASPVRTAIEPLAQYHRDHRRHRGQNRGAIATPRRDVAGGGEAGHRVVRLAMPPFAHALRST